MEPRFQALHPTNFLELLTASGGDLTSAGRGIRVHCRGAGLPREGRGPRLSLRDGAAWRDRKKEMGKALWQKICLERDPKEVVYSGTWQSWPVDAHRLAAANGEELGEMGRAEG